MPPKQKTPFEKYVQERKQLRRSFNSIFNEASSHFAKTTLTDDEIALVKGSLHLLYTTFKELRTLERELRVIALEVKLEQTIKYKSLGPRSSQFQTPVLDKYCCVEATVRSGSCLIGLLYSYRSCWLCTGLSFKDINTGKMNYARALPMSMATFTLHRYSLEPNQKCY